MPFTKEIYTFILQIIRFLATVSKCLTKLTKSSQKLVQQFIVLMCNVKADWLFSKFFNVKCKLSSIQSLGVPFQLCKSCILKAKKSVPINVFLATGSKDFSKSFA